jgi:hypothetical protein
MTWAHQQEKKAYPAFVRQFDQLRPQDVIWEPYSIQAVMARAPLELSSLCTRDQALWLTTSVLVFNVFLEPHMVDRVMRQFSLRQEFPLPRTFDRIPRHQHS